MSPIGSKILAVATGLVSALAPNANFANLSSVQPSITGRSTPIDLSSLFNNKAASACLGGQGNFDAVGGSYPAEYLPNGTFAWEGIQVSEQVGDSNLSHKQLNPFLQFSLPPFQSNSSDNVVCSGQTLSVTPGRYFSLNALLAVNGPGNPIADSFNITYADGSLSSAPFIAQSWWGTNPSNGAITA